LEFNKEVMHRRCAKLSLAIKVLLLSTLQQWASGGPESVWPEEVYPSAGGIKQTPFGLIATANWPWVYAFRGQNWIWIAPGSSRESMFIYSAGQESWCWTGESQSGWLYDLGGRGWVDSMHLEELVAIYLQGFANNSGSAQMADEYGWRWFHTEKGTEGTRQYNRVVTFSGSNPVSNVEAPAPHGEQIAAGNWTANSDKVQLGTLDVLISQDYARDLVLRMEINHSHRSYPARFAIRTAAGWHVSAKAFVHTGEKWQLCESRVGAVGWRPLSFIPGQVLALEDGAAAPFSSIKGDITAVGFFIEPDAIHRLDNFSMLLPSGLAGSNPEPEGPAAPELFDLYLLIGQSNMAGRGVVEEIDRKVHPRVWSFGALDSWIPAQEPLHFDIENRGVGPGFAFGRHMAGEQPERTIGLLPCAVGGTLISYWAPDHSRGLYAEALRRARLARKFGTLRGVLWQQGESDSSASNAPLYEERLRGLVGNLRRDLEDPGLLFVIGGLPPFQLAIKEHASVVQDALRSVAESTPDCAFVEGSDLGHIGDELHYNSAAQRENGANYARAMLELLHED
jgi:hypothetical protein